jgi:hypothetical protein
MHTLYLGPSWAVQSYESHTGLNDPVKTNLAQELGLTNYTSLARYAHSNLDQFMMAQQFMQRHTKLAPFRIVFVTANSLRDGPQDSVMSEVEWAKVFLVSRDPVDIAMSLEQEFYKRLDALGIPVALIGAHTDVVCESHNNITVIHPSWQNFLGEQSGLAQFRGWAADIAHRWLQGIYIPESGPPATFELGQDPSPAVVDEVYKIIVKTWMKMGKHKLFSGAHPNIQGNQLFAQEIAKPFKQWIDNAV